MVNSWTNSKIKVGVRVLHLSAASENTGAGKAVLLTHQSLLHYNIESRVLFLKSNMRKEFIYSYDKLGYLSFVRRYFYTFLDNLFLKCYRNRKSSIFSPGLIGLPLKNNTHLIWADVIHIHWANHGFIDIHEIKKWNKPIVWTLRDMWAFTGGCHYSFDCLGYENHCGVCPALNSSKKRDLSFKGINNKNVLNQLSIRWVAISSWMKSKAKRSNILKNAKIDIVYSGVDGNQYAIGNKNELRKKYNFSKDDRIIILGAANFRDEYKGFSYVLKVLNELSQDIKVITFGSTSFQSGEIEQPTTHFGFVSSDILQELYSISDVFFSPSIAEAFGKTFLEAQMCGCPVVCFDETGPSDIIEHKISGYLAKYKDAQDLVNGLEFCLNNNFDRVQIRNRVISKFDIRNIALGYKTIYEESYLDWSSCKA